MRQFLSIRLFAMLFALSLTLSAALAYHLAGTMEFAFPLDPDAADTLAMRIQSVRAIGLGFALLLMLLVVIAGRRKARGALAVRWMLSVATSMAFLRGTGLVAPLAHDDRVIVVTSALQLVVEAFAILLLYGEDATTWFDAWR